MEGEGEGEGEGNEENLSLNDDDIDEDIAANDDDVSFMYTFWSDYCNLLTMVYYELQVVICLHYDVLPYSLFLVSFIQTLWFIVWITRMPRKRKYFVLNPDESVTGTDSYRPISCLILINRGITGGSIQKESIIKRELLVCTLVICLFWD